MFLPLSFIMTVSAVKDLFEDMKRHQEDSTENNSMTLRYRNGLFEETSWRSVRVGDIIKVLQLTLHTLNGLLVRSRVKNICQPI